MELIVVESADGGLTTTEVLERWPVLSPLLELDDPPYRFTRLATGLVVGAREFASYTDSFWFMEARAGCTRRQTPNRSGPVIAPEATNGSVPEALEFLLRPAHVIEP